MARLRAPDLAFDSVPLVACSTSAPTTGRVFHVDPVRGSPAGDGSRARPWRDFDHLVAAGLIGESRRSIGRLDRLAAGLLGRAPAARLQARPGARLRAGDTLLLASGDYGDVDLSGLVNSGFVTIAAAPGATPRLASLDLSGASHFVVRGIAIAAAQALPGRSHLVTLHAPGAPRADNILLEDLAVSSLRAIAATPPDVFEKEAPSGVILAGDCVTLKDSRLHDVGTAVSVYQARRVLIAGNAIDGIAIDGIQFSGRDILIRGNVITNQWPVTGPLHPDCMQGAAPGPKARFGPVEITGNVCIRGLADTESRREARTDIYGWQGISIFDGHWRGVTVRCNLVLAGAQHGMALYGAEGALIEGNVVHGTVKGRASWIAVLPAKDGRQSSGVLIAGNRASAYLNGVRDAPVPLETMIDAVGVKREDGFLLAQLRGPVTGLTLGKGNVWRTPEAPRAPLGRDPRFVWEAGIPSLHPRDAAEALRLHPLPASCAGSPATGGPGAAG
ncbi:right-handed parallel beta-helix repeat-containing protein [Erythrobacter sp. NE805]|uniref:right-handed parallel beta-helix repeat-containing protein n=1 Tax=Erythrobacter sp. NE805 TaxID=3389875 RepID=UPI00396B3E6E